MSNVKTEKSSHQKNPTKGRSFNEWIDMVYAHVEMRRAEQYGFNRTSTIKT